MILHQYTLIYNKLRSAVHVFRDTILIYRNVLLLKPKEKCNHSEKRCLADRTKFVTFKLKYCSRSTCDPCLNAVMEELEEEIVCGDVKPSDKGEVVLLDDEIGSLRS